MTRSTFRCLIALFFIIVAFYWKLLLTNQFSLLTGSEAVNQAYSWYTFWIRSIRHGSLPIWDPYAFGGREFLGEMQTGAAYPLNLLLLLFPLNRHGLLSPQLYNCFLTFQHLLAAWFMFALVRELKLSRLAGIVAACAFTFGGFFGAQWWPHMIGSEVWTPLIFLFLIRATSSPSVRQMFINATLSGVGLGLSILAGGLHIAMMQAIVILSALLFFTGQQSTKVRSRGLRLSVIAIVIALVVGGGLAAVQLLPSHEYSGLSVRWVGPTAVPSNHRIPYFYVEDNEMFAQNLASLLSPAFASGKGEITTIYVGVLPFLLALLGIWKGWRHLWVRYLTGLGVLAILYSLVSQSLIHGFLYAVVPYLWMAREAPRFLYLTVFSLALLSAYGLDFLLEKREIDDVTLGRFASTLKWITILCIAAIFVPPFLMQGGLHPWSAFTLLMILASCGVLYRLTFKPVDSWIRVILVALIVFDLGAYFWGSLNKLEVAKSGNDKLEELISLKGAASFLKTRPLPFRAIVAKDPQPNIADAYGIATLMGGGVTFLSDYIQFLGHPELLNVRYLIKPASAGDPEPIYQDSAWKVYENPKGFPHAWLVHETTVESSDDTLYRKFGDGQTDLHKVALLRKPLPQAIESAVNEAAESVTFESYAGSTMTLNANAQSTGLLVLSELYYPGWRAELNGHPVSILKVDGALQGIIVPRGINRISIKFTPVSVYLGGVISILTLSFVLSAVIFMWRAGELRLFPKLEA